MLPDLLSKIAVNSRFTASLLPAKHSKKIGILYPSVDPGIAIDVEDGSLSNVNDKLNDRDATRVQGGKIQSPENHRKIILFVGRLVKRKGVDDLLLAYMDVLKRLPDSKLEIVGDGPELVTLQKLSLDLGIALNVQFLGKLSGPPLYQRYRACDVFVMPSKATEVDVEGFGTVFLEAGIFGKPSIGTISGGIPEAIRDGITGLLVPEGDVGLLSQALEKLLFDPDLAQRLGESARNVVLGEFTWDHSTKRLVSMLKSDN